MSSPPSKPSSRDSSTRHSEGSKPLAVGNGSPNANRNPPHTSRVERRMKPEVFRLSGGLRWLIAVTLSLFIAVGLAALFGLMEASKGVPMSWAMRLQIPTFLGTPCAIGILWAWRSRIVADEVGLRWRGLGGEKVATWDQVEDYFITFSRFGQSASRIYMVRFQDGRKLSMDSSLAEFRRLQKIISERTTNAKNKGWLIRGQEGTLSGKIVAAYTEKEHRKHFRMAVFIVALFSAISIAIPFAPDGNGVRPPWWSALFGLSFAFVLTTWGSRSQRFCRRFLGQRIEADEMGFTVIDSLGEMRSCPWQRIQSIKTLPQLHFSQGNSMGWNIETESGTFPFLFQMENGHMLVAMVRQYAPQAFALTQPAPARDALAPTEKTDGRRTFHYRTRSNRGSLWVWFTLGVLLEGLAFYLEDLDAGYSHDLPPLPIGFVGKLAALTFVGWAYGLWRYKSARLVLDGEGVTQFGLIGAKRVGYEEIGRLGAGEGFFVQTHDGRRPIRWLGNIADAHELRLELEKRTGLRFLSAESVEDSQDPAKQPDDVEQKLKGGHAGR
jgi:ABC-type amino acid transport system permease subunit